MHHEIQTLANLTAFFENRARLRQMSRQARELFSYIHTYAIEGHFLPDAILQISWQGAAITHCLAQSLPQRFLHALDGLLSKLLYCLRHQWGNTGDDLFDVIDARQQHRLKRSAFALAGDHKRIQRILERGLHIRLERILTQLRFRQYARPAQQFIDRHRACIAECGEYVELCCIQRGEQCFIDREAALGLFLATKRKSAFDFAPGGACHDGFPQHRLE